MRRPAAVRRIPAAYLHCRTHGHAWSEVGEHLWPGRPELRFLHGYTSVDRCGSCKGFRRRTWSYASGETLTHPQYRLPKGYRLGRFELPKDITLNELLRSEWSARAKAGALRSYTRAKRSAA